MEEEEEFFRNKLALKAEINNLDINTIIKESEDTTLEDDDEGIIF